MTANSKSFAELPFVLHAPELQALIEADITPLIAVYAVCDDTMASTREGSSPVRALSAATEIVPRATRPL